VNGIPTAQTRCSWFAALQKAVWPPENDFATSVTVGAGPNRSHYVRDVTFGEDSSRTRINPGHFARFRSFAINIMRENGIENIARELYINTLNFDNVLAYRFS
jgi:hypothetical protein